MNCLTRESTLLGTRLSFTEDLSYVDQESSIKDEVSPNPPEEHSGPPEGGPANKKKSWMALASYVDELTLGGRRDSKGHFVDNLGSFPGFGYRKKVKVPQDCFPKHFYEK